MGSCSTGDKLNLTSACITLVCTALLCNLLLLQAVSPGTPRAWSQMSAGLAMECVSSSFCRLLRPTRIWNPLLL
jgi:hypothetical protein